MAAAMGIFVTPVCADGSEDEKPIVLDSYNFYELVYDRETDMVLSSKPWFIEFYAPWCRHCQRLHPTWDELYLTRKDQVNIARVDCESDTGKPLC